MTDKTAAMTRPQKQAPASPWHAIKCPCGHPACKQYTLTGQGTVGFEADDARLLCAAANSYTAACGAAAVACAEADLLGEALAALRRVTDRLAIHAVYGNMDVISAAHAVLAKAQGGKP